jgi:regulator of sigma D
MLAEMNAKMDANLTKMATIWSELEETTEHQMKHFLSYVDESMQNLPEAKKTVLDPEMMQSM